MAQIGNFTRTGDTFDGTVKTLEFRQTVRIIPADGSIDSPDAPDFIVFAADVQVGAAWKRQSGNNGMVFYSVTLDDPSLTSPINATLFPTDADPNRFQLVWKRYRAG
jgi:uncharacterized protein (DUF736 family)